MKRAYEVFAAVLVLGYALASWNGWGIGPSKRGIVPAGVRQSPGGYRSYGFWRGGK